MIKSLSIGILSAKAINITLNGDYLKDTDRCSGQYHFRPTDFTGDMTFIPADFRECSFELEGVTIGKDFHWQKEESQRFRGSLILRSDGEQITAINVIPVEEYLKSVISSEMNPNASPEFLKAHAIISRTWLMNRIQNRQSGESRPGKADGMKESDEERIRWYDDSQHVGFDVCADDHCQRYQGITRITNGNAVKAVEETAGQVLTFGGEIIDARFSKCCGGAFETFENCWQPVHKPCLEAGRDITCKEATLPDLTVEANARKWIDERPEAFCNTADEEVLSQVLNDYDLATKNFYRWRQDYSRQELSDIINTRSGIDFGDVSDLIPLQRGVSGRITRLKIVGSKRTMIIGKELEIRKTLSPTHLYSSAFTVSEEDDKFILHGAGWGHGVGLCQIGAAMMARLGYTYRQILAHYYPGSECSISFF